LYRYAEVQEVEKLLSVRNFINEKHMPRPLVLRIKSYYRNLANNSKATNRDVIMVGLHKLHALDP
jgi:hypothetical protein